MDFKLKDARPIWQQLAEQLRQRIVTGVYAPGSRFPSVRELAAALAEGHDQRVDERQQQSDKFGKECHTESPFYLFLSNSQARRMSQSTSFKAFSASSRDAPEISQVMLMTRWVSLALVGRTLIIMFS